jgi:aspartyl-tRNA(Asn)/glutamyl-tRNA(Gln) amidotransferase subunit C
MSKLSRDDILKLARLSRLKLTEDEVESFKEELSKILDYVETLSNVDTKDLSPTYQVTGLKNAMRPDEVKDYRVTPKELLKNAPLVENGQFKVKRVL